MLDFKLVERVEEYLNIEQEIDKNDAIEPPQNWPQDGAIEVRNIHMRYSEELPDVLQGVTFIVKPHEKIAVVGRTGF